MSLLFALGLGTFMPADAKKEHILPIPKELKTAEGDLFITAGSAVKVAGIEKNPALLKFFKEFGVDHVIFDKSAKTGNVVVKMVNSIAGAYDYKLTGYDNEAYLLRVNGQGIEISAVSEVGVIRAAQTLTQLAEGYEGKGVHLEYVDITDWPAFKLRGFMHDIGRSYISVEMIKRHIDLLSRFKVNTFHWHLTENQGFRFEVKAYPQLNKAANMTRHEGKFYTQAECKAIVNYALNRGVIVIPEIDMPGHSAAFERAMGFDMQSADGKKVLKKILDEVGETFARVPYIHIGADEHQTTPAYVNEMIDYVKQKVGKQCVIWNPMRGVGGAQTHADMCQLWSTGGGAVQGKANIDCRYNYTNHFDVFADLVGIYKSNIYYRAQGDELVAGTISAHWNDRLLENEDEIVNQNNFYASVIASASRAWQGGGKQYIDKENRGSKIGGGVTLPNSGEEYEDFKNWENRFLFHKAHSLKNEPIPYVRQTNVRWRITDAFNNEGDVNKVFPPEIMKDQEALLPDSYTYEGNVYGSSIATGAGIYLRHTWGPGIINGFYKNPAYNQTAYAWTYVYSPKAQTVGAQIEFQNYSRSELDPAPAAGKWDLMGSNIWINGKVVPAPKYKNTGVSIPDKEVTQKNENFAARKPIAISLKKGWNKVFLKLPYVNAAYRLDKWMFTCVFTDLQGKAAVDGLIYSPNQCLDEAAETVAAKVADLKSYRNSVVKDQPGYWSPEVAKNIDTEIAKVEATFSQEMSAADRVKQLAELDRVLNDFKTACQTAAIVQPKLSEGDHSYFYTLSTPLRENRFATSNGVNADIVGNNSASKTSYWKFVTRSDKDLDIVNFDGTYVSPNSVTNTALKTQSASPSKGWKLGKADAFGFFIITSGNVQFNQINNGQLGYKVYNWGSGSNISDTGCKYAIKAVDETDLVVDSAFPQPGMNYYFSNKHKKGDQYFYDNSGNVGFSAQKMINLKSYVWSCQDAGHGNYYFKNLATGRYLAWKSLSATACEWALSTDKSGVARVTNDGCVSMEAVNQNGSNFMVCVKGGFDQARNAGFYTDKFSSDFKFEPCTNTEWDNEDLVEVNYYSEHFGDNWVRLIWNRNPADAVGLAPSDQSSFVNRAAKSNAADLTTQEQLWTLVGNKIDGFYLQNAVAGEKYALNVSSTASGSAVNFVTKSTANKWFLIDKGGCFAIVPVKNKDLSLNSFGGVRKELKLYDANDPGSKWNLQCGIVEGFKMSTVIVGDNPYAANNIWAGELNFVVNGVATSSAVSAKGQAEATYYLPARAQVSLSQENAYRGYAKGGFIIGGKAAEKVDFTVGEKIAAVKAIFNVDLTNGQYLYHTPGSGGKPYRIPAIATAKNGDIFAISDFRPCGMDIGYGEVDIKCRISKDNGKTWGDEFFIADGLGDKHGGQVWKTGFGDAAFVADAERNELLVMMVCGKTVCWKGNYIPNSSQSNPNRVARVRAKLNEATGKWEWTKPEEVTESIYPLFVQNGNPTVQSLFIGSGRICQSRVIKVGDYYRLYCSTWTKNQGNRVIYSDDFGETWKVLGKISDRPGRGGDEPKCEELPDGSVVLSSRRNGRLFNIYKYTDEKSGTGRWLGEQYSEGKPNGIKVGNSTNGEIMMLNAIRQKDKAKVVVALQSVPFGNGRSDVGFFFKEIDKTVYDNVSALASDWTKGLQVSHISSAYSTMTLQKNHRIGFYFEEAPGDYSMVYIPLTLEKITNGKYALDEDAYVTRRRQAGRNL